jgi:hypothetical protein
LHTCHPNYSWKSKIRSESRLDHARKAGHHLQNNQRKKGWSGGSLAQCLSHKHEALNSSSSTAKKKKKEKDRKN